MIMTIYRYLGDTEQREMWENQKIKIYPNLIANPVSLNYIWNYLYAICVKYMQILFQRQYVRKYYFSIKCTFCMYEISFHNRIQ